MADYDGRSVGDDSDLTSSVLSSVSSSFGQTPTDVSMDYGQMMAVPPTPVFISPPTIAGLPVTTFSYIFLAIGGAAPILFIIIVVISMKCYSWRRYRRFRRYVGRLDSYKNPALEFVEFGSRSSSAGGGPFRGRQPEDFPGPRHLRPPTTVCQRGVDLMHYASSMPDARLSSSNPNVYFRETPVLIVNGLPLRADRTQPALIGIGPVLNGNIRHPPHGMTRHLASDIQHPEDVLADRPRHHAHHSITSEEARALACFDHIYKDMDLKDPESTEASSTDSGRIEETVECSNLGFSDDSCAAEDRGKTNEPEAVVARGTDTEQRGSDDARHVHCELSVVNTCSYPMFSKWFDDRDQSRHASKHRELISSSCPRTNSGNSAFCSEPNLDDFRGERCKRLGRQRASNSKINTTKWGQNSDEGVIRQPHTTARLQQTNRLDKRIYNST